jgi:hypothetical protein
LQIHFSFSLALAWGSELSRNLGTVLPVFERLQCLLINR